MYILSSYDKMQLSGDMSANYRQESNFFWLTKINQSGWMLVRDLAEVDRLVRPDLSDIEKKFDGYLSDEAALSLSGAAEVWSLDKLKGWLGSLDEKSTIGALKPLSSEYLCMTVNPSDERVWAMIEGYGLTPRDIREVFAAKRAIKSVA